MPFPSIARFYEFMAERERIRLRRLQGSAPPWTKDKIMAKCRLTNVHRCDDRTTEAVIDKLRCHKRKEEWQDAVSAGPDNEGVRKRRKCAKAYMFNIVIWRSFGTAEFINEVGWTELPEDPASLRQALDRVKLAAIRLWVRGFPSATDAYKPAIFVNKTESGAWKIGIVGRGIKKQFSLGF